MLQRGKPAATWVLLRRLFQHYLHKHQGAFVVAMIFMAIAAGMTGLFTLTLKQVVDGMIQKRGMSFMTGVSSFIVAVFFVRGVTTYLHTVIMNQIGQRIVTDVQQEMYGHLMESDLAFFHANASGTLISRMINDVALMRQAVGECLTNSFKGSLTLAGLIGAMFYQDWQLSSAVFVIFPISAFYVARMGKRMRKISSNTQASTADLSALLNQTFQGIRHVKAYGNEHVEEQRVKGVTETIYKLAVKGYRIGALTSPVMELLSAAAISFLVIYGYWQVDQGLNTPGALVSFIMSFVLAYDPMKRLAKVNSQFQSGLAAAERVFDVLDMKPAIVDRPSAKALDTIGYNIGIEDVVFRYADGTQALNHLSIKVPHGKTIAIVGSSGAGKSTVINLIPRFYDVQSGRITIGSIDVRDVTIDSLRAHIALVSQETALFDDTIRANIAYGKRDATPEQIEAAAIAAFADTFIRGLPQGYDTLVGEHGVKLSGGQRQRIAIARAMLRNAPILLLDEATSALDNESERAVQAALKRLQQGRTTIVVAHRLSTVVDADQIIVLERGTVVEQGTHAELLAKQGAYARLYGLQANFG
jgi:ATP-binding cassette, subfamily B, bacterial MsbA